jgi:hypothetical protein
VIGEPRSYKEIFVFGCVCLCSYVQSCKISPSSQIGNPEPNIQFLRRWGLVWPDGMPIFAKELFRLLKIIYPRLQSVHFV